MVDSGVFHLDYLFDYLIPIEFESLVIPGVRVQVQFNGVRREGIVYAVAEKPERAGRLSPLEKVLGEKALVSSTGIELVQRVSQRWAAHPYDVWRSALPPRIIAAEKKVPTYRHMEPVSNPIRRLKGRKNYLVLPFAVDPYKALLRVIGGYLEKNNVLLVFPDEKDIGRFLRVSPHESIINISSSLPKAERYANYLAALQAKGNIIVGNRAAIFATIPDLAAIIVHREISENHYEPRTPGWNTRDVALIRSELERCPLIFTGYGPSSELAREIEEGSVLLANSLSQRSVIAQEPEKGELIPSRIFSSIKRSLKDGPVLCLVPQKGYASGLICLKCRNIALHECGGVISQTSMRGPLICSRCLISLVSYLCSWCQGDKFAITGRGSLRAREEIGRAFPGIEVKESSADSLLSELDDKVRIVIATNGAQPLTPKGYAGIFILDARRMLAGIDMRSLERSNESFFATVALAHKSSIIGVSLDQGHPLVSGLSSWNISRLSTHILRDRREAGLPPFKRVVELYPVAQEIHTIESGLISARRDGRISHKSSIVIYGKTLRIYVPFEESEKTIGFIHEFQRKRSIAGKKLVSMRVDPYNLN